MTIYKAMKSSQLHFSLEYVFKYSGTLHFVASRYLVLRCFIEAFLLLLTASDGRQVEA